MVSLGYFKTNTTGKCDKCMNFKPRIKKYTNLGEVIMCHGTCKIKSGYHQRTDTCKKFEVKS